MADKDFDPNAHLLLIVGAHPRAERDDRPLAHRLRDRIDEWFRREPDLEVNERLAPFVMTDLWYLNAEDLRERPAIVIGDPEFNAASAYLANRLPEALVIDGSLRIGLDLEFIERRACLLGVHRSATASAVDLFIERYLDNFLRAAHNMPLR